MRLLKPEEYTIERASADYTVGTLNETHEHLRYLRTNTLVGWFSGVNQFLDYLQEFMAEPKNGKDSVNKGSDDFNAFESYEEMLDVYQNRPDEVLEFDTIDDAELKTWEEVGNAVAYDVTGDFVDIGRYMHGVPEVFGSMHNGNPKRYRVDIVLNLSWSGSVHKDVLNERLKHTVALVDWLEMNSIRTSVTAVSSNDNAHAEINVKDYHQHLDLRQLAVASHSEFLRRAMFRWKEYSDAWSYNYGSSRDLHRYYEPSDNLTNHEISVFIDSYHDNKNLYADDFSKLRDKITKMIENDKIEPLKVLS